MDEETKYGLGCELVEDDPRNYPYSAVEEVGTVELPASFRLEPYQYNQRAIDSCVGQAVGGAKSVQEQDQKWTRFLWSLCKREQGYQGWGTNVQLALKMLRKFGIPKQPLDGENESSLPREEYMRICDNVPLEVYKEAESGKIASYWYVFANEPERLKRALFTEKVPWVTTMNWFKEYNRPVNGFLPHPRTTSEGHAYIFIGWEDVNGREKWIFKNSFGKDWGVNGEFYVWADEVVPVYKMGTFFGILDIPQDKAKVLAKYNGKLVRNADNPAHYYVGGGQIAWIENEQKFYFGVKNKFWGEFSTALVVEEDLTQLYDFIF